MTAVLVVEGNRNLGDALGGLIEREGLSVEIAHTLVAARKQTASRQPDALLMDPILRDGCGLDVLPALEGTPAQVLLTASGRFPSLLNVENSRVRECLSKPIAVDVLRESLRQVARVARSADGEAARAGAPRGNKASMESARRFIRQHAHERLELATVAEFCGMSRWYFSRRFKQVTGVNFIDFLVEMRIKRAVLLLEEPRQGDGRVLSSRISRYDAFRPRVPAIRRHDAFRLSGRSVEKRAGTSRRGKLIGCILNEHHAAVASRALSLRNKKMKNYKIILTFPEVLD